MPVFGKSSWDDAKHVPVSPKPRFSRLLVGEGPLGNHPGQFGLHANEEDVFFAARIGGAVNFVRKDKPCDLVSNGDTGDGGVLTRLYDYPREVTSMGFVRRLLYRSS